MTDEITRNPGESVGEFDPVTGVAYGLRITGFSDPALQGEGSVDLPLVSVSQRMGEFAPLPHRLGPERAEVGDTLVIDRRRATAVHHGPVPLPSHALVHPTLAWVGAVFAHWRGNLAVHGGAFTGPNGAWMVLGTKGGGKSSTLAALTMAGVEVLTDDLIVVDEGRVLAGPRCVDLKEDPGILLGGEVPYRQHGERRRILLGATSLSSPLAGAVMLRWGERLEMKWVPARDRLDRLIPCRTLEEADPRVLLRLATVPTVVLTRPRTIGALPEVVAALCELASN